MVKIFGENMFLDKLYRFKLLKYKIKLLKLFLFVLCFINLLNFISLNGTSIELSVKSLDGQKISGISAGMPFSIEVQLDGVSGSVQPEVQGLQDFSIGQRSFQSRTINGQTTIKNVFHARSDKPGKYKVGPAKIEVDGKIYESNVIDLAVEVAQQEDPGIRQASTTGIAARQSGAQDNQNGAVSRVRPGKNAGKGLQNTDVFAKLFVDKDKVVLGQRINCTLIFYSKDGLDISLDGIDSPEIKDAKKVESKPAVVGKEKIDGDLYNYVKWTFSLITKKTGILTIPAFRVVFKVPVEVDDDIFGGFLSILNHSYEQASVYSNPLSVTVQKLPEYNGIVDSVGKFTSFEGFLDRTVAKQGDGVVYTLELEGQGDLDGLEIKELKNMPQGLKYYDSKRYMLDNSAKEGMQKKRFEFIIQGLQEGEFNLPIQKFTFFDSEDNSYKELRTKPISLKIVGGQAKIDIKKDETGSSDNSNISNTLNTGLKLTATGQSISKSANTGLEKGGAVLLGIRQSGNWYGKKEREINFWLFMLLVLSPIFIYGIFLLRIIKNRLAEKYAPTIIRKSCFANAIKSLNLLESKKDFAGIYSVFLTLFADKYCKDKSLLVLDDIRRILSENNFLQQELSEWDKFADKIMAFSFYSKNIEFDKAVAIFDEAKSWVEKFQQKLN